MTKWQIGDTPCEACSYDWIEYPLEAVWEGIIGTYIIPTCGDDCCHERIMCEDCNGTGIEPSSLSLEQKQEYYAQTRADNYEASMRLDN